MEYSDGFHRQTDDHPEPPQDMWYYTIAYEVILFELQFRRQHIQTYQDLRLFLLLDPNAQKFYQ